MGNIASIHFKPTRLSIQEKHNDRSISPSYVLKSGGLGVECNRNAQEARALRDSLVEQAKTHYQHIFNQPFKAKNYLHSAVVNIKPDTTMQELEALALRFQKRFKFQCYQIAIHRDEGHINDEGVEQINHHAHLEFVTLHPITGKSMYRKEYINFKTASYMQKLTAKALRMERGKPKHNVYDYQGNIIIKGTSRKRIEPRAYGALMEQARAHVRAQLESEKVALNREIEDLLIENTALKRNPNYRLTATLKTQENDTLKGLLNGFAPITNQKGGYLSLDNIKDIIKGARQQWIAINHELGDLKLYTKEDYKALRALKEEGLSITELKARIATIEQKAKERYEALQEQYKDYLSPEQVENKEKAIRTEYKGYISPYEAKTLQGQADTAKQELAQERKTRQDEIKGFCKELRRKMAGKGFKREHFSQLEQWAQQAQDELIDFAEFERVALAIFGEQGAMLENAQEQAREQYESYLSPEQVASRVEAQRQADLKNLCTLVGVDSKGTAQESRTSLEAGIRQRNTDLSALCERAGGGKWVTPKYAKENLEKSLDKLKEQADKAQLAEGAKTELENKIKTQEQAHTKAIEAKDKTIAELTTEKERAEKKASGAEQAKIELETAINALYRVLFGGQGDNLSAQDKLGVIRAEWQKSQKAVEGQADTIHAQAEQIQKLTAKLTPKPQDPAPASGTPATSSIKFTMGVDGEGVATKGAKPPEIFCDPQKVAENGVKTPQELALKAGKPPENPQIPINATETPTESKAEPEQVNITPNALQAENEALKAQNEGMAKELASKSKEIEGLLLQNASLASTAQAEGLAKVASDFYTLIALYAEISPETRVKADDLKSRLAMAIQSFDELNEELPDLETLKKILQEQKGGGGKHI